MIFMQYRSIQPILFAVLAGGIALFAPKAAALPPSGEWIVLLNDAPVVERYPGRIETTRAVAEPYRQHLRQAQQSLRAQIEQSNIRVTGAVEHLLNGLFVRATPAQAAMLRAMPGVKAVMPLRRFHMNDQLTLSNVASAWSAAAIGGENNAGAGLKIGIIDSGIDQTNPSFFDSSSIAPPGFPKYDTTADKAFTTNKVIVARSYVASIAAGSSATDPAADSRPDVLTARDMDGHGTAVASVAAGVSTAFDGVSVVGVAPKAFLGNYKIYGSPEVNNTASESGILEALDDAVTDGMDVVNFSSGAPPFSGPLDTGSVCGNPSGAACDPIAMAMEEAVTNGQVVVVAAAGNEGADGYQYQINGLPTFGTIASPADAPSVMAAGGIENDVAYVQSVAIPGNNVPADVARVDAYESADGPQPGSPLTAALVDVTTAGDSDELLCDALSGTPLANDIALVLRGTCTFDVKVLNAQSAGAVGIIIVNNAATLAIPEGLGNTTIPAFMVSQTDGQNLKTYIDANPGAPATMDPNPSGQIAATVLGDIPDAVAYFASRGPATGTNGLKPDMSAVATEFLVAAEDYDPNGDLFSTSRFAAADGTSFSSPMLAGAAALVKQANPGLTPLQIKSALVNTATLSGLLTSDGTAAPSLSEVGSGILQAQNAVISTVQIVPSTVSFGLLSGALPSSQTLKISNSGTSSRTLTFTLTQPTGLSGTQVQVNGSASAGVTVAAGQTGSLIVSLSGSVPAAGRYEGLITATGGPMTLGIPYMFLVASNTIYDVIPLSGAGFDGPVSQELPLIYEPMAIRVIDNFGAPVANAPVAWSATLGTGTILSGAGDTTTTTDQNGIAYATVALGPELGPQEFTASVDGGQIQIPFDGNARDTPAINAGGIVDGASFTGGRAVAPGSIVSIFGTNLSDDVEVPFADCPACTVLNQPLPLGIDGVAFSFDVPPAGISVPGRFYYVSPTQLNVQVPWELAGQSSATVKAFINYTYSAEYTLALATYSPGFFTYTVNGQQVADALDTSNSVIGTGNPARRGNAIQLFMNGLGPVSNPPASGAPGLASPLSHTTATPVITIGGQAASVSFSGLAPDFVGLYQVNAVVPEGIGTGLQTITCSIGGVSCPTVYLPVQ